MADYKNIPLGLRTQTQIPLDVKEYIQNESLLSNLGVNGQLAYTYTKGLVVYCIEESTRWEWTEVKPGLEDTGLINQDFIYSDNHIAFGIDYSNKRYNFFKVINNIVPNLTEVLLNGNETEEQAIFHGSTVDTYIGGDGFTMREIPNDTMVNLSPLSLEFSNVNADVSYSIGKEGVSFFVNNNISTILKTNVLTTGIQSTILMPIMTNGQTKTLATIDDITILDTNTTYSAGTGLALIGTVFSVENLQKVVTSNVTLSDVDNDYTIFINNGAIPITITINSSITIPNFCVGFIQEGTGDVTFVGSGVSLTNPVGLKSKGQGYQTFIERKLATSNYFLLGNTKF